MEVEVSKILDPPQINSVCVKSEDVEPPPKKVKCARSSEEFRILQDLANTNKAVFSNCNFNFGV